ncbi:tetratricopeptide repeat protein, partial [candidate division TA06 bacterium]|nr:tetratricopeptide repeat protein [candidate division TA06 bacterium]
MDKSNRLILLGIFLFAFLLRILYIFQIRDHPYFTTLLGDPSYFDNWAQFLASGRFLGAEPDGEEAFFKGPLYPFLLAALYRLFGHNLFIVRVFQIFLGSMNCLLIALIARKVFDQRVATIAGLLAALCGTLIYFDGEILITTLAIFLNLLILLFLVQWFRGSMDSTFRIQHSTFSILGIGFLIGLSAIARPNILIFLISLFGFLLIRFRRRGLIWGILLILGTSLPILPVTLWNFKVGKDFVLISYQAGVNFYIGNNPHSDGRSAVLPGVGADWDEISLAERDLGRRLKPSEVDRYWFKKGLRFIREEPWSFTRLLGKKLLYFWNGYEIENNQQIYFFKRSSFLLDLLILRIPIYSRQTGMSVLRNVFLHIPFGLVAPLGILGIWFAWKDRQRIKRIEQIHILLLFLVAYMLSVILFFVTARYRMTVVPILILFTAYAVTKLSQFSMRQSTVRILFLIPLILITNIDIRGSQIYNFAREHFNLGLVHMMKEEYGEAEKEFKTALEIHPAFRRAHLNLGVLHFRRGNRDKAIEEYRQEMEINPQEARSFNNLALLYRMEGRYGEAKDLCLKAITLRPRFQEPYLNLARTYEEMDSLLAAERTYLALLEFKPSSPKSYEGLGRIYDRLNLIERSIQSYQMALRLDPEEAGTHYNLGVVYGKADSIK